MKQVEWYSINGFEGYYEFNINGQVKTIKRDIINSLGRNMHIKERILKHDIRAGYPSVVLQVKEKKLKKHVTIHRLIAEAFIPNPDNKPQINHKNGVKSDFRLENLEWVTASENVQHAFDELDHKTSFVTENGYKNHREKRVYCSNFDVEFQSAAEAERKLGISNVPQICNGRRNQRDGLHLRYMR